APGASPGDSGSCSETAREPHPILAELFPSIIPPLKRIDGSSGAVPGTRMTTGLRATEWSDLHMIVLGTIMHHALGDAEDVARCCVCRCTGQGSLRRPGSRGPARDRSWPGCPPHWDCPRTCTTIMVSA